MKIKLKARIIKLVLLCLEAFGSGLIFRAAEHSCSLFLLTSEVSMRDGGCLKEVVHGGNSNPEYLWRFFAAALHSFPLSCPVVTVFPFVCRCRAGSLARSVNCIVTGDGNRDVILKSTSPGASDCRQVICLIPVLTHI